jgi:hypothetical protein
MWFKCIVFLAVSALNSADLVCDWLLFKDVIMTQEGLVYGPPEPVITWCLLAFSILGTFTFVFEIVNLWWEVFRENPWIDSDLASAITIWIEDVPQIALNVAIVVCREEAISYFQLVKASVLIFGICIRLIVSFVRYCSKDNLAKTRKNTKWAHQHIAYRVFIMFGLIIIFFGSVTVFLCTQFERSLDGNIKFNIPHTLFEEKYDDERYFDSTSARLPYYEFSFCVLVVFDFENFCFFFSYIIESNQTHPISIVFISRKIYKWMIEVHTNVIKISFIIIFLFKECVRNIEFYISVQTPFELRTQKYSH